MRSADCVKLMSEDGEYFDFPSGSKASEFLGRNRYYIDTRRKRGCDDVYAVNGEKYTLLYRRQNRSMQDISKELKTPDDGYLELANAIIIQAAEDYRLLTRPKDYYQSDYDLKVQQGKIKQLEKFFLSGYGNLLCRGMGEYILIRLKNENFSR